MLPRHFAIPALISSLTLAAAPSVRAAEVVPLALTPTKVNLNSVTLTPVGEGAKLTFAKADWPSIGFTKGKSYESADWSNYGGIAFELRNPDPKEPLALNIRVDDSPEADGLNHCRTGYETLAPGETVTLVFSMGGSAPKMRGGPPLVPGGKLLNAFGSPLNEKNIIAFQIFLNHPSQPRELEVKSVRLVPKPDLVGIVDKLGQYSKVDWPGKVKDEAGLKTAWAAEMEWRAKHPALPDRDEYGGWKNGPALKATGFFRTAFVVNGKEQTPPKQGDALPAEGRWWLVTPSGHPFWSAGVTCVRPYQESPIDGRESMFMSLPEEVKRTGQTDFYRWNIQKRFASAGDKWLAAWANDTSSRLQSLGFNTIANWSEAAICRANKVPYVVSLWYDPAPQINAGGGDGHHLPDFFDPKFPEQVKAGMLKYSAETKDDPWCIGYFVDNELAWDTWAQLGTGGEHIVARDTLAAPATQPARQAFIKILKAKYPTPADWGKAWGISVTDWETPVMVSVKQLNEASRADCSAFLTALAERYFSVVQAAVKEAAPKHLYLGCRFAIRPYEAVNVAAKYCDVISFNIYSDTVAPNEWAFAQKLGKPLVIGEYHFGATDRGMFHTGLRGRANQAERAKAFQEYVQSVTRLPAFVGCHWFQYVDEPLTGRFDGENYNIGFATVTDTLYPEMRDAARAVHAGLYTGIAGSARAVK
jgi:hypothetical protein